MMEKNARNKVIAIIVLSYAVLGLITGLIIDKSTIKELKYANLALQNTQLFNKGCLYDKQA